MKISDKTKQALRNYQALQDIDRESIANQERKLYGSQQFDADIKFIADLEMGLELHAQNSTRKLINKKSEKLIARNDRKGLSAAGFRQVASFFTDIILPVKRMLGLSPPVEDITQCIAKMRASNAVLLLAEGSTDFIDAVSGSESRHMFFNSKDVCLPPSPIDPVCSTNFVLLK